MSNNEFHQRRLSATPRGVGVMCNFFAQSAENATLKDVEGNEYIDFAAGEMEGFYPDKFLFTKPDRIVTIKANPIWALFRAGSA